MPTENNDQVVVEVEAKKEPEPVESNDAKGNADRKDSQRGGDSQRRGRNNNRGVSFWCNFNAYFVLNRLQFFSNFWVLKKQTFLELIFNFFF